jgi:fatty-acyl-CoA synthase
MILADMVTSSIGKLASHRDGGLEKLSARGIFPDEGGIMRGQMMDQPLLISGQIEFAARFHGSVEVVTRSVEGPLVRSTWGEVARRARRMAQALVELGVRPGDRVATLAWNTHRHLELYFAVSGIGAVLHTINPRLPLEQLHYVVDHAEDQTLFFDTTFVKLAQLLAQRATPLKRFVALTDAARLPADAGLPGLWAYEDLLAGRADQFEWPMLDENTASSLCYTSGTAGNPKGVLYSHRSTVLHSYAATMADTLGISGQDVTLPVVPMFHVNAWGVPYAAAMVGSKLVLPGPHLDGQSLADLIEGEGVTSLLGVPTVWLGLLGHLRLAHKRLTTVRKVTIGGSACPPSMIEAFEKEHGARVIHAWGMTEMSPLGTVNVLLPKHQALDAAGQLAVKAKQGRAVYGVDLRLVDDEGRVLPHDGKTSGHLQVRGPWVASAYFKRDVDESHVDGWFSTGDIANIDGDGYVQITDRSKDVIKSGGEWVSSIDLENAAMSHPAVAQAAAIGLPHPKWQERPLLLVVKAPGQEISKEALRAHLEARLARWWLPDAIEFIEALPLGATGKVLKRELRARFAGYVFGA